MEEKAATKAAAKRHENEQTMRAMRKQLPMGTCGICGKQNQRIVGRLTTDVNVRVCTDCYADGKVAHGSVARI